MTNVSNPGRLPITEFKCVSYLKQKNLFVGDTPYNLDEPHQPDQTLSLKLGMHMTEVMDLTNFFTKLFQLPNFLDEIIDYNDSLDDPDWISNITQTQFCKDKVHNLNLREDEMALPLFMYFDESEPLNALSSHSSAYKLGGVYMNIPCLPPSAQSKLMYIFLAMLVFSCDLSIYGNKNVFPPLITQLNKLQTDGLNLNHKKFRKLKLLPILFIGDNLGLNTILGFSNGLNANFYCRFCKSAKPEMQKLSMEDKTKMRDKLNYECDCDANNFKKTGIKENSVFNELNNFHVACNPSVDLMHDFLEGVCHVVICALLFNFIYIRQLFTLQDFNNRLKSHQFGPQERNTNIPLITAKMLQKNKIKVSASEMFVLFTHFPFLIGDLVHPDTPEWKLYLLTSEILTIVMQKIIHKNTPKLLRSLIFEHHELFKKLFIKKLTPKMHFVVHYPNIMEQIGPLCHVSSMRFESYHKIFKNVIKNINCRKNLLKSC